MSVETVSSLRVFTVATDVDADGFLRFNRSANVYGLKVEVIKLIKDTNQLITMPYNQILGANTEWLGGDVQRYPGGGQKVNLLRDALKRYKDDSNLVVLFVDSYDVIFTATVSDYAMETIALDVCRAGIGNNRRVQKVRR